MKKIKNLLVELLAVFIIVSGTFVANTQTVYADDDIASAVVSIEQEAYTYTGKQIQPTVTSVVLGTETELDSEDYEVSYGQNLNVGTNVGTVTVTAKAGSGYTGSVTKNFTINPLDFASSDVTVTYAGKESGDTNFTWTGNQITPTFSKIRVIIEDRAIEIPSDKYDLSYGTNIAVGNLAGKVTVTLKTGGNITGAKEFSFNIVRKPAGIEQYAELKETLTYNGNDQVLLDSATKIVDEDRNCIKLEYGLGTSETSRSTSSSLVADFYQLTGKNAGRYYVYSKISPSSTECGYQEDDHYLGYVDIKKANYSVTTPEVNSLTYNGKDQALTNLDTTEGVGVILAEGETAGDTKVPVIQYAIGGDGVTAPISGWTSTPVSKKEAGTYYLWYRVIALDTNHNDYGPYFLSAIDIAKKEPTITLTPKTVTWDGTVVDIEPASVTLVNGEEYSAATHGTIIYKYYKDPSCQEVAATHSDAGIYYVTATLPESANYSEVTSAPVKLTINKANSELVTAPQILATVYTAQDQLLVSEGTAIGGDLVYAVTRETVEVAPTTGWNGNVPKGKYVGDYKVWYKVQGDENHYNTSPAFATVHINKAVVEKPVLTNKVFNGETITSGLTNTVVYTVEEDIGGTNVGEYKVKLQLIDAENYIWEDDTAYEAYNTGVTPNNVVTLTYHIIELAIDSATITINPTNPVYTGEEIKPTVVSVVTENGVTVDPSGYDVTYENNINVNTAQYQPTVIVTAKANSNYRGSWTRQFQIVEKSLTSADVTIEITNLPESGSFTWENTQIKPTIKVMDRQFVLVEGKDYTVEYTNNVNVTDASSKAKITITGIGNYKDSKDKLFEISKLNFESEGLEVSCDTGDHTYTGYGITPPVVITYKQGTSTGTLVNGTDYHVVYSNNVNVTDEASVMIYLNGNPNITGTKELKFPIVPKALTVDDITISVDSTIPFVWNGQEQKPGENGKVSVVDASRNVGVDETVLISPKDYTLRYKDNINAGVATVYADGAGNYTGTISKTFTINKYDIDPDTDIIFDRNDYTYTGSEIKPEIEVKYNSQLSTLDPSDYTVTYSNNKNVGQATITVAITNPNCEGTKVVHFNIVQKDVSATSTYNTTDDKLQYPWCGQNIEPFFVLKDGDITMRKNVDYTLSYVDELGEPYTGEHKDVDTYYVKADFKGNYKGNKILTYDVAKLTFDDIEIYEWTNRGATSGKTITDLTLSSSTYNGSAITKDVELRYFNSISTSDNKITYYNRVKLLDVDGYDVDYEDNIDAGTAKVAMTIKANPAHIDISSKDRVNLTFTINPKPIAGAVTITRDNATAVPEYAWSGIAYTPTFTVTDKVIKVSDVNYVLDADDYSYAFTNNTLPGDATFTITGKGNYTGTETATFKIHALGHDDLDFSYSPLEPTFDYGTHPVVPILTYKANTGNGGAQLADDYYTYEWTNHINATNATNKATVDITLVGDYTTKAKKSYEFVINAKDISNSMIVTFVNDQTQYNWCGNEVKPVVIVSDGTDHPLTIGTDYTVSYDNNVELTTDNSKASITVTGTGNYTGSKTLNFEIIPVNISDVQFYNSDNGVIGTQITNGIMPSETYDGTEFTKEFVVRYYSKTNGTGTSIAYTDLATLDSSKYDVVYENNKNAGTAKVTVTFKAEETHFVGSKEFTFVINPKNISGDVLTITNYNSEEPWKGEGWEPVPTIKDRTLTLVEGEENDFVLSYENNVEVGTNTANIVITGKNNYTGTKKVSFSIRKIDFDDIDVYNLNSSGSLVIATGAQGNILEDKVYTGSEIKPTVVLKLKSNSKVLTENTDFEVIYPGDNINYTDGEATADITVNLINSTCTDTSASKTLYFKINQKVITNNDSITIVTNETAYPYIAAEITPTFKVKDGTKELVLNQDFENVVITQTQNYEPGTGTIQITGKGNYTGTKTGEFVVRKLKFSDLDVKYKDPVTGEFVNSYVDNDVWYLGDFVYDGKEVRPEIKIVSHVAGNQFNNIALGDTTTGDYDLVWSENRTNVADDSYVDIKIKGAHLEESTSRFKIKITPRSITSAEFDLLDPVCGYKYNGKDVEPTPTNVKVKVDDTNTLNLALTDYDISYTNNIEISDSNNHPTVTLTGVGNYKDSVSKGFTINDILIQVSQEVDGDLLVYSDNKFFIDSLTETKEINNLAKIEMTVGTKTHTYYNDSTKNEFTKVDANHLVIPYSKFVDDNKDLMKDSASLGAIITVTTSSTATGSLVTYNSQRSFSNIPTIRGIEVFDIKPILEGKGDMSEDIYLDGQRLAMIDDEYTVTVYDGAQRIVQTYTYNKAIADASERHTQYANGMRVYTIDQDNTGHYVVNELTGYANVFRYDGTALRLVDPKGLRFFTTINKATKNSLVNAGANGYKLVEMGSILAAENDLSGVEPYLVQNSSGEYKAPSGIKIGKAKQALDSGYYSDNGTTLRYSTVLKDDNGSIVFDKADDLEVRSYMVLRPVGAVDASKDIIIYTGTLYRSISYVASQALPDYIGTASEAYIRSLIVE